jgi:hypothetical protein
MCGLGAITGGIMAGIIILMVTGLHHQGQVTDGLRGIGKITGVAGIGYQAIGDDKRV